MASTRWTLWTSAGALSLVLAGCGALGPITTSAPDRRPRTEPARTPSTVRRADPALSQRVSRLMLPLLEASDKRRPVDRVKVGLIDDPSINAANAGGGEFYVTRGLLERANDEQLQAVLAHEIAHDELGHVAKAQILQAGVGIGAAILEQVFPATGQIAPLAGTLITRAYSRSEELAADRHAVKLLQRVGAAPGALERTLAWLQASSGGKSGGGGFLATHPGIGERIEALRRLQ